MLRVLPRSQGNVVGIECSGKITKEDYIDTLIPTLNQVIALHGKVRILMDFTDKFDGYEIKALLEDMRYSFKHFKQFEKCAVVNGSAWVNIVMKVMDKIAPYKCRAFEKSARDEAWSFIED